MQIALTPAPHDTTAKALIYALMPVAGPSLPANLVLPKYVFADKVYRKHPPKLRERAPACVTFTRTFGAMASCIFPGRTLRPLSSRQCTSPSVRRHSWPFPEPPFISAMHQSLSAAPFLAGPSFPFHPDNAPVPQYGTSPVRSLSVMPGAMGQT